MSNSKHPVVDAYGKQLLQLCRAMGFVIANGRLSNDKTGEFTFCNSRGASVVDYLLLKNETFQLIENFSINEHNEFSDHACLSFTIKGIIVKTCPEPPTHKWNEPYIAFDIDKVDWFRQELSLKLEPLQPVISPASNDDMSDITNTFTQTISSVAMSVFAEGVAIFSLKEKNGIYAIFV